MFSAYQEKGVAVDTYVVTVYRRGIESGKEAAGLVEHAGSGERKAFASSLELWAFLCDSQRNSPPKRVRRRRTREES